jgi:AcrR family transcriptional regulator
MDMSRRERMRDSTREEIKEIARQQMVSSGTALLSLNSIAREMEMTTPGLYRYFANRDELITALILDAHDSIKTALRGVIEVYPTNDHANRLFAAMLMYREWAMAHPVEYQLIACSPIPEYQPPQEILVATGTTIFGIFLMLLQAGYDAGLLRTPMSTPDGEADFQVKIPFPLPTGIPYTPVVAYQGVVGWYRMHGMIMLEMFQHVNAMVDSPAAFYRHEVLRMIRSGGFEPTI